MSEFGNIKIIGTISHSLLYKIHNGYGKETLIFSFRVSCLYYGTPVWNRRSMSFANTFETYYNVLRHMQSSLHINSDSNTKFNNLF